MKSWRNRCLNGIPDGNISTATHDTISYSGAKPWLVDVIELLGVTMPCDWTFLRRIACATRALNVPLKQRPRSEIQNTKTSRFWRSKYQSTTEIALTAFAVTTPLWHTAKGANATPSRPLIRHAVATTRAAWGCWLRIEADTIYHCNNHSALLRNGGMMGGLDFARLLKSSWPVLLAVFEAFAINSWALFAHMLKPVMLFGYHGLPWLHIWAKQLYESPGRRIWLLSKQRTAPQSHKSAPQVRLQTLPFMPVGLRPVPGQKFDHIGPPSAKTTADRLPIMESFLQSLNKNRWVAAPQTSWDIRLQCLIFLGGDHLICAFYTF